jgi:hypothetical protein
MIEPGRQIEFFRTRLGRIQPKLQVDQFRADLARLNLEVLSSALLQTEAIAQSTKRAPKDARAAVLAQYERTAASIAQLFPVFFVFESAWRSFVAARLPLIYGRDDWWHPVREAVLRRTNPLSVKTLGSPQARSEVLKTVAHVLGAVPDPSRISTTYELVAEATLGHVETLIDRHWTEMSHPFTPTTALRKPTSKQFGDLFKKVRRARNDAYHHRVVSDRRGVIRAAEQLMDVMDLHLGERVRGIHDVQLPALPFEVLKESRHT